MSFSKVDMKLTPEQQRKKDQFHRRLKAKTDEEAARKRANMKINEIDYQKQLKARHEAIDAAPPKVWARDPKVVNRLRQQMTLHRALIANSREKAQEDQLKRILGPKFKIAE